MRTHNINSPRFSGKTTKRITNVDGEERSIMSDDPKTFLTSGRFDYALNVAQIRAKDAAITDHDLGNPSGTGNHKALEDFPRE